MSYSSVKSKGVASVGIVTVLVMLLGMLDFLQPAQAIVEPREYQLTHGHIDLFSVTVNEGKPVLHVADDTGIYESKKQFLEPQHVTVVVDAEKAKQQLPDSYDFVNAENREVYLLPQSQDQQLPWPGWSTELLPASLAEAGLSVSQSDLTPVFLDLEIAGPGEVFTWQTNAFGEVINRYVSGKSGVIPIAAHAHVHTTWAFTQVGSYKITVIPRVKLSDGSELVGDAYDYEILVKAQEDLPEPEPTVAPTVEPTVAPTVEPVPTPERLALHVGHIDLFEVSYQSGKLQLQVKDDTGLFAEGVKLRSPESVVIAVNDEISKFRLGDNAKYSFLGAPGEVRYLLPQSQDARLPWPGWSTERLNETLPNGLKANKVFLDVEASGPGVVNTWQTDAFGEVINRYISDSKGRIEVSVPAHVHTNWAFGEKGEYLLKVVAKAELSDGSIISSGSYDYKFVIGETAEVPDSQLPDDSKQPQDQTPVDREPASGTDPIPSNAPTSAPECIAVEVVEEVATAPISGVTSGHFDFGSLLVDGKYQARIKDDRKQPPSWVKPETITFAVGDSGKNKVPNDASLSFLGAPGTEIHLIGQVQQDNVPWLGWNTQHESIVQNASGPVTFTLESVQGPGEMAVYSTGSFGGLGTKYFGSINGFPKSMTVPINQHVHGNWAFTKPGVYRLLISQSVNLKSGESLKDTATLTIAVGDTSGVQKKVSYVGRTPDGDPCELDETQKAALAATGFQAENYLVATVALVLIGGVLVTARNRMRPGK